MVKGQIFEEIKKDLNGYVEYLQGQYEYYYNLDFNFCLLIVDNYEDFYDCDYGNGDVCGLDVFYGMYVVGIIVVE